MLLRWSVLDFVPFVQSHEGCLADGDVVFLLDLAYSGVNGLIAPLVQHFPRDKFFFYGWRDFVRLWLFVWLPAISIAIIL